MSRSTVHKNRAVPALAAALILSGVPSSGASAQSWSLADAPVSFLGGEDTGGAGRAVSVGDLDDDGHPDVAIGSPFDDAHGADSGRIFLFSGDAPLSRNTSLDDADVIIGGAGPSAYLGWSFAGVGDVNDDGFDDLAVGAPLHRTGDASGTVWLFFGPWNTWGSEILVEDADVTIEGEHLSSGLGMSLSAAGDINGDGRDDLWVGAPFTSDTEDDPLTVELDEHKRGRVHLLLGRAAWPAELTLGPGSHLWISGEAEAGMFGMSLAGGADISGDGVADMCAGSPSAVVQGDSEVGQLHCFIVLRAMAAGGYLTAASRFAVEGTAQGEMVGASVALVDFDGNGVSDVVVGAPYKGDALVAAGAVAGYSGAPNLPFGLVPWSAGVFDIAGSVENGCLGYAVSSAGDLLGNGYEHILLGAPGSPGGGTARGAVYVLAGRPMVSSWPSESGDIPIVMEGEFDLDRAGVHVSSLGDVGYGYGVFMVGSVHSGHAGWEAGKVYLTHLGLDVDDDGDGFTENEGDCRDDSADSYPGAGEEIGRDDDCDGWTEGQGDCDDGCANCFPGAPEIPDGLDNDCDGEIDEVDTGAADADGDGWTDQDGDCDDGDPAVYPGADEECNGIDDNCNGVIDDDSCGDDDDSDPGDDDDDGPDDDDSAGGPSDEGCECASAPPGYRGYGGRLVAVLLSALFLARRRG